MARLPAFTSRDRLLVFAPHPDDEALATGALLQRAAKAGAAVRVIFLTDGDKNPWPQRVIERRWRMSGSVARARWGALRRDEALASLLTLGHGPEVAEFWSLPDQGLTDLLLNQGAGLIAQLDGAMTDWQPTWLAAPSASDRHPDHSALGVATALALRQRTRCGELTPEVLAYLVHGVAEAEKSTDCVLPLSEKEVATKRSAILCHRSQTLLSRRRFLAHAGREEVFRADTAASWPSGNHPLRFARRDAAGLNLAVSASFLPRLLASHHLHVLVASGTDELRHHRLSLPRLARLCSFSLAHSPDENAGSTIFLKLQTGPWLYGAAGWLEVEAEACREKVTASPLRASPP